MTSHEDGDSRGWSLLPPNDDIKKEGKFLLFSDSGSGDSAFSVNWMGLAIGLIIVLFCKLTKKLNLTVSCGEYELLNGLSFPVKT